MGKGVISFSLWAILATSAHAQSFPQPLPVEEIPAVVSLPNPVPTGWLYVHDLFFNSILDGRVVLVDPSNVGTPVKAQVRASQFGSFIANDRRGELYTAETFYSRLTRGDRTDAVTIWDRATLALLWQKYDFWDSLAAKCMIHGEPALTEAGDGRGLAGGPGAVACPVSGGAG